MSDSARELALRKDLLLAQCSLYRLKMRGEVEAVRRNLTWSQAGVALASAGPVRNLAFNLAVDGVGRDRVARVLGLARRALAFARVALIAVGLFREATRGTRAGAEADSTRHS
ncbi:MAG: hypothetical protein IPP91_05895 [Betaproteobacteria bacterium]|nr:hypothetical protein [Betaproteobacteria bacterium]